jgi:nucleotide-binding universal stress UspA family protein
MYKRILLANDGSLDAGGALAPALALAHGFDAYLEMLVVISLPRLPLLKGEVDDAAVAAKTRSSYIISVAQQRAEAVHVAFHADMVLGDFVERTLGFIDENRPELLVIGKVGRPAFLDLIFGNAVDRLAWRAPCSVHLVKA